jgi:C-terminal processing protease CtpA/Prc
MRTTAPERIQRGLGAAPVAFRLLAFRLLAFALFVAPVPGCFAQHGTIGAVIAQEPDTGRLFLRDVPHALAADRAGLKTGDEILLIDGVDVRVMDAKQIHAVLTGEVDTPVKLTVVRGEQVLRVTLKRTEAKKLHPPSNSSELQQ